jgi:molybdopterin synthase catalytic subunit
MIIDIALQEDPLDPVGVENIAAGAGAVVRFEGRVRAEEKGAIIKALDYEAYEPMAQKQMEKIAHELGEIHACLAVRVRHRTGRVPVGEAAILVDVCARHRGEAFAFVTEFMNRIKQDVPIWKAVGKS